MDYEYLINDIKDVLDIVNGNVEDMLAASQNDVETDTLLPYFKTTRRHLKLALKQLELLAQLDESTTR